MPLSIENQDDLLGIEIRHLIALAAVARTGSFSAAGRELGYAQSAISQQIAMLERVTGHRLFDRPGGPKPVTLTEAGEIVLGHAEAFAARLGALRADLERFTQGHAGRLRIAVFQSASARLLPIVLPRFKAAWPNIDITLRNVVDAFDVERMLAAGEVDVAFCETEALQGDVETIKLLIDPMVVVVARDHPFADRVSLRWTDFEGVDRISYDDEDCCTVRIAKQLADAGVTSRSVFQTEDNLTVQRLAASGLGVAVMATLAVERSGNEDFVVVPFDEDVRPHRTVALAWDRNRYLSPAATAFIDIARQTMTPPTTGQQ